MNALVTGGSGFVGFNLVKRLLQDGWGVLMTGRMGEQAWRVSSDAVHVGYELDKLRWFNMGRIDVLFHQAAITDTTVTDKDKMYKANLWDSMKLFEDAYKHGVRQIVYASSCATYGNVPAPFREDGPCNPLNVYGESKYLLDQEAMQWGKANGVNIVGLRYSNVYGPHECHKGKTACMVTQIGTQMLLGNPRLFKYGEHRRDFVYVKDVVEMNLAAARYAGQDVFNAGSGVDMSFNEVVGLFNEYLGVNREPEYIDNPYQAAYQNHTVCDMSKAERLLGIGDRWSVRNAIADYFKPIVV
jgi:ADP-L-glycero-D-manno-heptose 6-epimerase